jgi:soluble lytic murein transglycosylase
LAAVLTLGSVAAEAGVLIRRTCEGGFLDMPPPPPTEAEETAAFRKAVDLFHKKQFDEAAAAFTAVPELGDYLSLYKHWFYGQSLMELGKYDEAEPEFDKIMQSQASSDMKYQAEFFRGELALRQKKYHETIKRLTPLAKKWRRSYRYPEVIYRLMSAELKLGNVKKACQEARKLYAKYPAHPLVLSWGSDLKANEVDGKKIPCKQSEDDFSDRMRSLQWSGESEKAHQELVELLGKAGESDHLQLDLLMASFMVNEGNVDDALNRLIRYYPRQKSNFSYLMLLGKAAARSGEYQTAVGAYERAYELNPRSKRGREALYQAAYLSYQFQDYDGAVRKFQQFIKANPRSGLAKDAEWHLAWLQYLRNDFKGALEKFKQVAQKARSRRRKNDSLQERLLYWMAMSHIRLNQPEEARAAFERIIAKNAYSYYGLAAQARLDGLSPKLADNSKRTPAAESATVPAKPAPVAKTAVNAEAAAPAPSVEEEGESEEDIAADEEDTPDAEAGEGPDEAEKLEASDVKDPAMRARLDVAAKLTKLGLNDLAKWELWEVERHTRNPQYLRRLINSYEGIGSYNRSATIADLNFGKDRDSGGFDGARALWVSAYPQAFKDDVVKSAGRFGVEPEWVWAVMRTESMYRPDVISPVGARGLMQLMKYTARNLTKLLGEVGGDDLDLLDPAVNIRLGAQYLARLQTMFKGKLPLVAAAYNAGPHRVEGWLVNFGQLETDEFIEHIPFLETRNYVKKVVRYHAFYRRLYAKDQKPAEFLAKALGVPIPSRASTRESWDSL